MFNSLDSRRRGSNGFARGLLGVYIGYVGDQGGGEPLQVNGGGYFNGKFNAVGTIRSTGQTNPTSGTGVEMQWDGTTGYVIAYDRGGAAFKPLNFQGSTVTLAPSGGAKVSATATGVGIANTSPSCTLDAGGTIRATGRGDPTSGAGLELNFQSSISNLFSYDRGAAAYRQFNQDAAFHTYAVGGVESARIDTGSHHLFGYTSGNASGMKIQSQSVYTQTLYVNQTTNNFGCVVEAYRPDGDCGAFYSANPGSTSLYVVAANNVSNIFTRWNNVNTTVGSVQYNGLSAVQYLTSSDYRAKDVQGPLNNALSIICKTPVYWGNYKWGKRQPIYLAHEFVAAGADGCIIGEKDAVDDAGNPLYQMADDHAAIPLLMGAIQELAARLSAVEAKQTV